MNTYTHKDITITFDVDRAIFTAINVTGIRKSGLQYSGPNEPTHYGVCLGGHHITTNDKVEAELIEFSRSILGGAR